MKTTQALILTLTSGIILAASTAVAQTQRTPIIRTESGELQGVAENNIFAFKGIPYAEPPVGDLRWREPRPASPWQGVRKADAYGAACIQPPGLSAANGGDPGALNEDCLYLNVWTPRPDPSAGLPVMVWIHGGAYIFGAGGMTIYDGAPLARKGAVVVNLNYRLMQLGFFVHPALERQNPGGPANFGLLDQIAALTWVQQNIRQFGGDPANVTIFGQSAGGKSVLALFASPLARRLFQKGIAISSYGIPDATRAKALEAGIKAARAVGEKGADATAAELRAVPADRFGRLTGQDVSIAPAPISGDKVLPQPIQEIFAAGKEAPLPLMLGNTSDDASVVLSFGVDPVKVLANMRSARILVKMLYPGVKDDRQLARQATRDLLFTMPARWIADRHSKLAPSFRYYFDYTAVKDRAKFPDGVRHGAEIVYVEDTGDIFEGTKPIFTDEDRDFARRVSGYFFEFARTGHPASAGSPEWPKHDARRDVTMLFGTRIAAQENFMRPRLNTFMTMLKIMGRVLNRPGQK